MVIRDTYENSRRPVIGDEVKIIGINNVDGVVNAIDWTKERLLIKTAYNEEWHKAVFIQLK